MLNVYNEFVVNMIVISTFPVELYLSKPSRKSAQYASHGVPLGRAAEFTKK